MVETIVEDLRTWTFSK